MIATFSRKLSHLLISFLLCFSIIFIRLIYLQVIQWHTLYQQSKKNFLRVETEPALRGNIVDRMGNLLATNRPTINIYWQGLGNKKLSDAQKNILKELSLILNEPLFSTETIVNNVQNTERLCTKLLLAQDMSHEQLSCIVEKFPDEKNLCIKHHFKRFYPHTSYAAHLLGYLAKMNTEIYGKMGLEKLFEDTLKGQTGKKLKTINSFGRHLDEIEMKQALAGATIETTLDIHLQEIIEKVFPADWSGTFIIMDPEDGSLLALLSRPDFDPSMFLDPLDHEEWLALQDKHPFLNRAFNACYPPGSIFKLITLSAALEHHYILPDSHWFCRGYVEFAGREYHCNNLHGHGMLSIEQALAQSCNVPFFESAKRMNIDLLADYAHRYGLGKKTNMVFAEKTGLIPSTQWKKRVKREKWWPGETLSAAIGQSYILVTPIQVARMISSIFTGNLVKPRILMNEAISQEPLAVSLETRKFLQQSMQLTIKKGTGQRIRTIKDIEIYAKTSTAQTSSLEKRELGSAYLEHGWFAGYFRYKNNKPLTLVILVENIGSSLIATNLAKEFLISYKKLIDHLDATV